MNNTASTPPTVENKSALPAAIERLAFSSRELCQAIGVSDVTLWRLAKKGILKPIPGIRHRIYSRTAVERFLAGKVVAS